MEAKKSKPNQVQFDQEFTGNFPRNSGAISEVTGGPPEDINRMPASENPEEEGPIYDGSQLSPNESSKTSDR